MRPRRAERGETGTHASPELNGILNEVYYPTIDRPQIRDLQYLITDGETFFHGERQLDNHHERLDQQALGYRITNSDPQGRYRIVREVIADPHRDCVLVHTRLETDASMLANPSSRVNGLATHDSQLGHFTGGPPPRAAGRARGAR
jgi:GH15 family glucan-1,4-alpha-glucosidase